MFLHLPVATSAIAVSLACAGGNRVALGSIADSLLAPRVRVRDNLFVFLVSHN